MKSTLCAAALAVAAVLLLAACTTTNTIDGHQVRGIAAPETPAERAARDNMDVEKMIAALYGDDPKIQEAVKRRLRAERTAGEDPGNIHRDAPLWMHQRWAEYLGLAAGNYAVLALDRNGYGTGIVYCRGNCAAPITAAGRSWRDVNYKHRAIKLCKQSVREYRPAERPNCALYAIKDKIVWKGRLPWE